MYVLYDSVCVTDDLLYSADDNPVFDLVGFASGSVGDQSLEVSEGTQIATTYSSVDPTDEEVEVVDPDTDDGGEVVVTPGDDEDIGEDESEDDTGEDESEGDTGEDESGNTSETEEITITDVYNVTVTKSYLLAVIAFGVFLTCGILLGKAFWDRLKQ
ncbi:MAG: hypothetical protein LUE65_11850 [Clostridiales bacterium]|nr:hypothetical protein [Clostridiales bacterium]